MNITTKNVYNKRQTAKQLAVGIHVVIIVITSVFAIINYNEGFYYSVWCCVALSLNSMFCAYIHAVKEKYKFSNILTFVFLSITLTLLGYIEGLMSGYHLHFFTMVYGIPFFLRIRKDGISRQGSLPWYVIAFGIITLSVVASPMYSELYSMPISSIHRKLAFNAVGSFMTIIIFSILSIKSTNKYARALEEGRLKAEREKDARTRVLSNLGHELRTQITSINGVIQLITESQKKNLVLPNQNEDYHSILKYCNTKMLFLVNDIMDMHKIEVGKFELFLESKNLGEMLSKVILPFVNKAKSKNIVLDSCIDKQLFDVVVRVDHSRLTQVFHNLISNAIKFTEEGGVIFKVEMIGQTPSHVKVLFSVTDTGIGISECNHDKIFDSFLQIKEEDKPIHGGTGLGLAISKTIIEKMGSSIEIDSSENSGSRFFFEIDFSKSIADDIKEEEVEVYEYDFLEGKTILVVEDNAVNMLYTDKLLRKYGAETLQAQDGEVAVKQVENHINIDLVLLDLEMPKMNGFTAITHIKAMRPKLKVIAFTANVPDQSILKRLDELGFDDLVSKPFKREELFTILNMHLFVPHYKRNVS